MSKLGIDITSDAEEQTKVVNFPNQEAEEMTYQMDEDGHIHTKDLSDMELVKAYLESGQQLDADGQMRLSQITITVANKSDTPLKDVYYTAVGKNTTIEQELSSMKYGDFESKVDYDKYYKDLFQRLADEGHSTETLQSIKVDVCSDPEHTKLSYADMLSRIDAKISEEEYSDQLKARQAERLKQQEEKAAQLDYTGQVRQILSNRKIHNVHPRDLIDTLWSNLTPEMKEYYRNNPSYAAWMSKETPQFEDALTTCLDKFNKSVAIENTINDYLDKYYPNRTSNSLEIEKIAANCPEAIKTGDARIDAYLVIDALSSKGGTELTEDDLRNNPEVLEQMEAKFGANLDSNEPMTVAASQACDPGILENLSNKIGHKVSKSARTCDNLMKCMNLKKGKTVKQDLQERREEDRSKQELYEQMLRQKDAERERLEQRLREQEERIRQMDEEARRSYAQNNRYDYGYVNNRYSYDRDPRYNNDSRDYDDRRGRGLINTQNLGMKHIALIFNVIFLLFLLLLSKIVHRSTIISIIGLAFATWGILKAGKEKDATRATVGGYLLALAGIVILCF